MRRALLLMAVVGLVVALAPGTASGSMMTAEEFADDCNGDGRVDVPGTLRVRGGVGEITIAHCDVFLADGARLVFRDVTIRAGGNLVTWGGLDTTLRIVDSRLVAAGILELKTSCCFDEPGVPVNGLTRIVRSSLRGGSVYLSSAVSEEGGALKVRHTRIRSDADVVIPVGGLVQFNDNRVRAGGDLTIVGHDVRVRRNIFTAVSGSIIVTADGGPCVTSGNTPAVACS